jgi:hypothetical protein
MRSGKRMACAMALLWAVQGTFGQGYSDAFRQDAENQRRYQEQLDSDARRRYELHMADIERERRRDEAGAMSGAGGGGNGASAVVVLTLAAALMAAVARGANRELATSYDASLDPAWRGRQSKAVCAAQMELRTARFNYSGVPQPRIDALCTCVANRALNLLTPAEQRAYLMGGGSGFDGIHPYRLGHVFEPCASTPTEQADLAGVWTMTGVYPNTYAKDSGSLLVVSNKCPVTLVMYAKSSTSRDYYVRLVLDPGRVFTVKHMTQYGSPVYYHLRPASSGSSPMPAFDPAYPTGDPRSTEARAAREAYFARNFEFKTFTPQKTPADPDRYVMDLVCPA